MAGLIVRATKSIYFLITVVFIFSHAANSNELKMPPKPMWYKSSSIIFYIRLDGRWYRTIAQEPFIFFDRTGVRAPAGDMSNCRRSDGLSQQFSSFSFYYGPTYSPIYQLIQANYVLGNGPGAIYYLDLRTLPGNIICDREISVVIQPTPPDLIFKDHFENTIFKSNFE